MKTLPTSAAVREALNAADYPADKDGQLETARSAGAEETVLDALRALPLADYRSLDEVIRSVGTADPF
jgi:hypothetical protein